MARDLYDLAKELESFDGMLSEAAAEVAPSVQEQILGLGREGKALRAGNAVAAKVTASGPNVHVRGVFVKASKLRSWSRTVAKAIAKAVAKRLKG